MPLSMWCPLRFCLFWRNVAAHAAVEPTCPDSEPVCPVRATRSRVSPRSSLRATSDWLFDQELSDCVWSTISVHYETLYARFLSPVFVYIACPAPLNLLSIGFSCSVFPASTPSTRAHTHTHTHNHILAAAHIAFIKHPPSLSFCVCVSRSLSLSPLVRPPDLSVHWLLRVYFSCPAPNECPLVLLFPLPPPTPRLCPAHVLYVCVHPSPDVQVRRDVTSALELAAQGGFCHFSSLSLFSKKPWRLSHNPSSLRHLCIISNLFWMSKALMKIFSLESPF